MFFKDSWSHPPCDKNENELGKEKIRREKNKKQKGRIS